MKLHKKSLWTLLVLMGALLASTALIALRPDAGLRSLGRQRRGHAGAEQEADDERNRPR